MSLAGYNIYVRDSTNTQVDISPYVFGWSTQRGRSRELDSFTAGTFSLSLQNYDGRFLPEDFNGTTSPYGTDVVAPGSEIEFEIDTGLGTRVAMLAYVEDTQFGYDNQRVVTARISGADSLGRLARHSLQQPLTEVQPPEPQAYMIFLLDFSGWSLGDYSPPAAGTFSNDEILFLRDTGDNTLSLAHQLVTSEGFARLFCSKDSNDIKFQGRYATVGVSSSLTFGTGGVDFVSADFSYSAELLFNQVITKSPDTDAQTAGDSTSQTAYGLRSLARTDLLHTTQASVRAYGEAHLEVYKDPQARLNSLTVNLHGLSAFERYNVCTLEIGQVVTVVFTPRGADEVDLDLVIEGISHSVAPGVHEVSFQLSPSPGLETFRLDSDRLDVDKIGF